MAKPKGEKRSATRELTDRNWDVEDEPEDAGEFAYASEDVIKGRQFKKAKRRGGASDDERPSVFAGFGGFKPTSSTAPSFSLSSNTNGSNSQQRELATIESEKSTKEDSDFLVNLKSLNQSVVSWIKQHVDKNPYCILTPIFKDYEKHLEELEKDKKSVTKNNSEKDEEKEKPEKKDSAQGSNFTGFKFSTNGTTSSIKSGFSFGSTTSSFGKTAGNGGGFGGFSGFGSTTSTSSSIPSGFSFGSSLSTDSAPKSSQASGGGDEEEYVPPVNEVDEVKEEGAFYTKRCKLFYQKEGKWVERGVGNLHLKMAEEKLQLIIRADTNLGNIMLNIILSESIPVKKQGKNNVFFVCAPNPPFDPKAPADNPVPILLRVKTSEDAEELVSKVDEKRK